MYKAKRGKKYYIALHTFKRSAKEVSVVYKTGVRIWEAMDMYYYSVVIWRFRIMFGVNKEQRGVCGCKRIQES